MKVEKTHHIDACGQDNQTHFYEYDIYQFTDGNISYIARSYSDTPAEAHFLKRVQGAKESYLHQYDLRDPLFGEAISYLRNAGKSELQWLSETSGYIPIAGVRSHAVGEGS
jgi:hypothetical protein